MVGTAENRRVQYVIAYLKTNNDKAARKASGLSSRNTKANIIKRLQEQGTLADVQRTGRPVTVSNEALHAAWKLLLESESRILTGKSLLVALKHEGLVPDTTKRSTLLRHFRLYAASKGHRLMVNSRSTVFALVKTDAKKRLQYCRELETIVGQHGLHAVWFEDEKTLEEDPHPKSTLRSACVCGTTMSSDMQCT
jgi:transposase